MEQFEDRYKGMNLRPFTGHNVLPMGGETEEEDPFCGQVPQDAVGYTAYRRFFEKKMDVLIGGAKTMSAHANCEEIDESGRHKALHHQKPDHMGASIVFACNHVIGQDPTNPEGVKFFPLVRGKNAGFFLCKTCMRLEERHKLNFERVFEAILKINATHPDRLINLAEL